MRKQVVIVAVGAFLALMVPTMARAQATISGLVQDSTGAVLPGVTVEASSPALIERIRTAVSDNAGRYTIVDLRPGTYAVSFSLPGFSSIKREGIVVEGAATVQVNADLRVGALEETLTVKGDAPVIDVQSVRREFVMNREMLDALPVGRSLTAQVAIIPGVTGQSTAGGVLPTVHGSSATETYMYNDGMRAGQHLIGAGTSQGGWSMSEAASAELTYQTGAQSAEFQVGGVAMNAIPKEGGNLFAGTFVTYGAGSGVQSDNRTPELKQVIRDANRLIYTADVDGAFGGPLMKNKLWFFGGGRAVRSKSYVADVYYPDGSQAITGPSSTEDYVLRLTYQATPRNKFRFSFDKHVQLSLNASVGPGVLGSVSTGAIAPEAAYDIHIPQVYAPQVKWNSPVTNRLLLEAAFSTHYMHWRHQFNPSVGPLDVAHTEATTGVLTVASDSRYDNLSNADNLVASASYVTGSHNIKTGIVQRWGYMDQSRPYTGDILRLTFVGNVPNSVTVLNTPVNEYDSINADLGAYAQDRWTLGRTTLNLGARYDRFNASTAAQSAPAGRFVPARTFAPIENLPNWNDWAVRLGVAHDLFGNGKTAVKGNVNKYVAGESMNSTSPYNPMGLQSDARAWVDVNRDRTVLNSDGSVQYNEIGPTRNANFGLNAGTTHLDPSIPRSYNWEEIVSVQQELRAGLAVTAGYYSRQYYNLTWTDNLLVNPGLDYIPFTFTGPSDPRLPGGGGEVITMYNLAPAKLGVVDNLVKASPTRRQSYSGFEATVTGRIRNGAFFTGGVTTERTSLYNCDVDNPNSFRFCDNTPPYRTMGKLSGSYPLPYAFQASAVLRILPGNPLAANYTVTSAIAGVPLTGGGTLSVNLVEPGQMFGPYQNQLDLRVMRTFRFGDVRMQGLLDLYNALNASAVTTFTQTYGPNWLRPQAILNARYLRFGVQMDF
jgi:hypothetical protein